ncbi:zinc finger domain-containing protein [Streptomyces sp. NBC_01264]|uniref:zinc finger domain-containing protein n=1 Tax=Streptomyces sp. NBC_01264 TaxID=2903804 RepID=UPI00225C1615|nr:hypothetical protein [Streptomyces sp. NBC_01264]MCX4778125.1 hypothetical protein [Streptomyces sp. NBC_01264]
MIDYEGIGMLLGLAAARDQRTVGDADNLAWHADLNTAGITYAGAEEAITRFYVDQATLPVDERRRITTPDVISLARKIRTERLKNFTYEPPPGDHDPHYLARRRDQILSIADGRVPAPLDQPALTGDPGPQFAALLAGVGRDVPDEEAAPNPVKRRGPLGVACPSCGSAIGRPCRAPSRNGNKGRERAPHSARETVSAGGQLSDPAAMQAEADRRRAASALRLQQLADLEGEAS